MHMLCRSLIEHIPDLISCMAEGLFAFVFLFHHLLFQVFIKYLVFDYYQYFILFCFFVCKVDLKQKKGIL